MSYPCGESPEWVAKLLRIQEENQEEIIEGLADIMAAVQVEQADLDAVATSLNDIGNSLSGEIADLLAKIAANVPLTAGDLSGIQAGVAKLTALEPPAVAPVPPVTPPPVTPGTPPVTPAP